MIRFVRNLVFPYRAGQSDDLRHCVLTVDPDRPWLAGLDYTIATDAPRNSEALCCYIDQVIFYETPLRQVPGGGWAQHDMTTLPLRLDDVIATEHGEFLVQAGRVLWHDQKGWQAHWRLRRLPDDRGGAV